MLPLSGEGGSQLQSAANQVAFNAEAPLDGAATPATLENLTLEGENMPATVTYLSREYIWGPGDAWGWGVDELLVQYDQGRRASWPLQDAGGDVIALCDLGGTSGTARVITQIVYDAYGSVIGRDDPATPATGPPELRVGHKGLFFDRLDGGIADPLTGFDLPRLWPGARLSGYVRNRTLHCDFGRWNQPDPNATGLPVQQAFVFHGSGLRSQVQLFDLREHYAVGANVYGFLSNNPYRWMDPLGLIEFSLSGAVVTGSLVTGLGNGILGGVANALAESWKKEGERNIGRSFAAGFVGGFITGAITGGLAGAAVGGATIGMGQLLGFNFAGGAAGGAVSGWMQDHEPLEILLDALLGGAGNLAGVGVGKAVGASMPVKRGWNWTKDAAADVGETLGQVFFGPITWSYGEYMTRSYRNTYD